MLWCNVKHDDHTAAMLAAAWLAGDLVHVKGTRWQACKMMETTAGGNITQSNPNVQCM
jgi:hypothetical protein